MKKRQRGGSEKLPEDKVRFLTINVTTGGIQKHLIPEKIFTRNKGMISLNKMFVDLDRMRFNVPCKSEHQVKCLGMWWEKYELRSVEPFRFVYFEVSRSKFSFASKDWVELLKSWHLSGDALFIVDIEDLSFYVGEDKWKKI